MRTATLALTGLLATFGLLAPLTAQDILEATSGKFYKGQILSDDGSAVEFQTLQGATLKLPYAQLTASTRYRLTRGRTGADATSQLALAEWCLDETLYKEARRHYKAALAADATMADAINARVVKARTQAANEMLARAKGLMASRKPAEARQVLGAIMQELPLEEAAAEAARLLADDTDGRKLASLDSDDDLSNNPAGRPTRTNGQPWSDELVKTMGPAVQAYHKLLDSTQAGLESSKEGTSVKLYEKALKEGDKARKAVDTLRGRSGSDAELAEAVALADAKLEQAVVDCRIFLVDAYLLRSSYKQASDVVKQGLAAYPQNQRLQRASERVSAAVNENDNDRGGWVFPVPATRGQ